MKKKMTTKDQLLLVLKREGESTMKVIMEHFTISEIAIRRHLRELISQKFVSERSVKQEVGRPFHKYKLTTLGHNTFPNQDNSLPLEILKDVEVTLGREAVSNVLKERKKRESHSYESEVTGKAFKKQIEIVAEIQDEQGYMVEYSENNDGSFNIINYNCPVYNIASSYQEICHNEKEVLEKTFPNSTVISDSRIVDGKKNCCWTVSKPKTV